MIEEKIEFAIIENPHYNNLKDFAESLSLTGTLITRHLDNFYVSHTQGLLQKPKLLEPKNGGDINGRGRYKTEYGIHVTSIIYCPEEHHPYITVNKSSREVKFRDDFDDDGKVGWIRAKKVSEFQFDDIERMIIEKIKENEKRRKNAEGKI